MLSMYEHDGCVLDIYEVRVLILENLFTGFETITIPADYFCILLVASADGRFCPETASPIDGKGGRG